MTLDAEFVLTVACGMSLVFGIPCGFAFWYFIFKND